MNTLNPAALLGSEARSPKPFAEFQRLNGLIYAERRLPVFPQTLARWGSFSPSRNERNSAHCGVEGCRLTRSAWSALTTEQNRSMKDTPIMDDEDAVKEQNRYALAAAKNRNEDLLAQIRNLHLMLDIKDREIAELNKDLNGRAYAS